MTELIPIKDEVRTEVSTRFSLNGQQFELIGKQFLKYFLPVVLLGLVAYQSTGDIKTAYSAFSAGLLTLAINIISKFISESK